MKPGFAYACPSCNRPLRPHDGPWAIYHCLDCNRSVDLYQDPEPSLIPVEEAPEAFNPHKRVVILKFKEEKIDDKKKWWQFWR